MFNNEKIYFHGDMNHLSDVYLTLPFEWYLFTNISSYTHFTLAGCDYTDLKITSLQHYANCVR